VAAGPARGAILSRAAWGTLGLALAVFALNAGLNATLFLPGESPYRDSIEGGYASMARFFAEHPNPWGWNPFQYGGIPSRFWYLPGIPYLSAIWIRLLPFLEPEHVFRLVVIALACLGPVTVFLFALYGTRSRLWALGPALALTFFSPGYYFFQALDWDRGIVQVPWRIQTLIKYGEGPHHAALTLLPLALIALWRAGTSRSFAPVFIAAVPMAAIALTNWVGAMALAWCVLMMLVVAAGTVLKTGFLVRRVLAAAALAYLMACFWLTPEFIRTIAFNWPTDAFGYEMRAAQVWLLAGLAVGAVLIRLLFVRIRGRYYLCFLLLCTWGFGLVACAHYLLGEGPIPESRRYLLEAELFLFLLLFELLRQAMRCLVPVRAAAIGLALFLVSDGGRPAVVYVRHASERLRPLPREQSAEYQTAKRLYDLNPAGRVFVSGGTRFRLNSWFDLPQTGGTFESGLRNRSMVRMQYQVVSGEGSAPEDQGRDAVDLLQLMGVEYAAVHMPGSREHYRDVKPPDKFDGVVERVQDGEDRIYRIPFAGFANLVRPDELPRRLPVGEDLDFARPYLSAMFDLERPALNAEWHGPNRIVIRGTVPEGMWVTVRVAYDEGWRAWQGGEPIPVSEDTMEYLLLHPRAGPDSAIELRYSATLDSKLTAVFSCIAWIIAVLALWRQRMRHRSGLQ
jgi:hypothetical protein